MTEKEPNNKKVKIGVRVTNNSFERMSKLAEKNGMNLSEWVRFIIRNRINQIENPRLLEALNPNSYNGYRKDILEIKEEIQKLFMLKEEFYRIEHLIMNLRSEFPSSLEKDKNLEEHKELIINIIKEHRESEGYKYYDQYISTESIIDKSMLERDIAFDILISFKDIFEYDIRKRGWDLIER